MLPRNPRQGSFFDLSDRIKLRLTGADRIRFVNGQITNDVRKASDSRAIAACILNARGKLSAHVFVSLGDDCVFIDADAALSDSLPARLERYIIADDVQIEDVTSKYSLFHVVNNKAPAGSRVLSVNRFFVPGFDVWADAQQHDDIAAGFGADVFFCDGACSDTFRIEQGVPAWGRELTEEIIPVEANLEATSVDYNKGCYIGQEVISRMKMSGQRNKGLLGLVSLRGEPLQAGMRLHAPAPDEKEIGWITSATWSDRLGKNIGLGYVKRPFDRAGIQLRALVPGNESTGSAVELRVVALPFDPDLVSD
jgi:folate-binding protein YgfZ